MTDQEADSVDAVAILSAPRGDAEALRETGYAGVE